MGEGSGEFGISGVWGKLPILSSFDSKLLARMIPHLYEKTLETGDYVYREGSAAAALYIIMSGNVQLHSALGVMRTISKGSFGEEVAVGQDHYMADAVAGQPLKVLVIPKECLHIFLNEQPHLHAHFLSSLFDHYSHTKLKGTIAPHFRQEENIHSKKEGIWPVIGWLLAILAPATLLIFGNHLHMEWNMLMFAALFSSAVMMWMFRLLAEFIPALMVILGVLLLGIAPANIALSGYASDTYFMALSVFGVSVVLAASGLTLRIVLLLLKHLPASRFWYSLSVFVTGILLTPVVPSTLGRMQVAGHLFQDMAETLRYQAKGKAQTQLAASTYMGFTLFDHIFLSSTPVTFAIFALLPQQIHDEYSWFTWLIAASCTAVVMVLCYFLLSLIFFPSRELPQLTKEQIGKQLDVLGPVSRKEWAAFAGITFFFIGVISTSIHKIESSWVGLLILFLFLVVGILHKSDFQRKIDWTFMLYLGALIGMESIMEYVGVEHWLAHELEWMASYIQDYFSRFLLLLALCIFLLRMVLGNTPTAVICATIFLPLAADNGVNPWVVGFFILILSEIWFFPHQSEYYSLFRERTEHVRAYQPILFYKFQITFNFVRLLALFISIPYWKWLGML